jgi:hypothetical protein
VAVAGLRKLMVKPEHAPYRTAGGLIRIGGVCVSGVAGEVDDPTGSVWTLLEGSMALTAMRSWSSMSSRATRGSRRRRCVTLSMLLHSLTDFRARV